jgi:hypothetical protein
MNNVMIELDRRMNDNATSDKPLKKLKEEIKR